MIEMEVTTGAIELVKLQPSRHCKQTNTQLYRPNALHVAQPTVSEHSRGKYGMLYLNLLPTF